MMKSLKISGLALLMVALPSVAQAGDSPGAVMGGMPPMGGSMPHMPRGGMPHVGMPNMPHPTMGMPNMPRPNMGGPRNWGGRNNGRWMGGWQAPGGWNAYRRPFVGYVLPSYWVNPSFYLGNYSTYGFSRPINGYGWSRYYDDAVLTDRSGRVQDYVEGVSWDRYDRYDDAGSTGEDYSDSYGYREDDRGDGYDQDGRNYRGGRDRGNGIGGALIGGAVGAIAGGVIAGKGDNTAGALIGGGLGAITGAAIASSDRSSRGYKVKRPKYRRGDDRRDGYGYRDGRYGRSNGTYEGQWTGRWNGGPTQTYEGRYEGDYRGEAPHWGDRGDRRPQVIYRGAPSYGYNYGGGETTTIVVQQSQPIVTTTTTTSEEVIYAAAPRRHYAARRVWKPRPKARCVCR